MLNRLLCRNAEAHPDGTAIVQGDFRLTHAELERAAGRCARWLEQLGVRQGDAVAVVLPNCAEFIIAFFAIVRLRAIMLPLNPGYTREELRQSLTERSVSVLITDARRDPLCRECNGAATVVTIEHNDWASYQEIPSPDEPFTGDALYLSTSGSTDFYKRICCTHENLFFEAHNFVETIGLSADDPILCTIPLFHSYGLGNCLLDAAYSGATLVLEANSEAPFIARHHRVLELLQAEKIAFYPAVPYQFEILAESSEDLRSIFQNVKWCISSGDTLPRRTYDRFLARTGHPIRSLYGSTEAGSIAINTDRKERVEYFSLGLPLRNVVIEIRDARSHQVPTGDDGEIWVKSPTIPPGGYENRPDLTRRVFCGGFYNTGDVGHKDDRGHLILAGRKQSFINIGGYKVDTAEVEEVLASCPGVLEAAVLGVEVPRMGMLVKAAVVTDGSCTEADIRSFCRQRLAFYKVPRLIELLAALPRSAVGKVLKSELDGVDTYLKGISTAQTARIVAQLPASSPSRRRSLVASLVHEQSAVVLGRSPALVPRTAGFIELGMDSFGAIELRARLEYLFDLELAETFTFDYPTVDAVTENLLNLLPAARSEVGQIERK